MEKEAEEDICPIQQLPYEVLCKIFDLLDIKSVKQCSRTCRRWQETIFSDNYIKRFKLNIRLPLSIKGASFFPGMETLKQSDRLYSNVNLEIKSNTAPHVNGDLFSGIYTLFCYPKLEQLVTLKITIPIVPNNATRMITDAIKHMKVLRELYIDSSAGSLVPSNRMVRLDIRSHSIQRLVAHAIIPTVVNAPKLSSLSVVVFANQTVPILNEKLLYSCRLPNLKHLEIEKSFEKSFVSMLNVDHALRFFGNLKSLETLKLKNVHICGYLFKAICESCTNLTELFIESLRILETSTLHNLSKLANLRHLTLEKIECLDPVAFRAVNLPKLESVAIGTFPMLYETLTAFESATKITILGDKNQADVITAIATKMPNLKHVELKSFTASAVSALNLLTAVEVLTVRFPISYFAVSQCILTNIKEIHSLAAETSTATFIELMFEQFPTASDIKWLRTKFPTLRLLTVGKKFKQSFFD